MFRFNFGSVVEEAQPETALNVALKVLDAIGESDFLLRRITEGYGFHDPRFAQTIWGVQFPGIVGAAGGVNKNGLAIPALAEVFDFIEIGTVTREEQEGNPLPRTFWLRQDHALINRLGFNNHGSAKVAERLAAMRAMIAQTGRPLSVPLAGNVGKSRSVNPEDLDAVVADVGATVALLYDLHY